MLTRRGFIIGTLAVAAAGPAIPAVAHNLTASEVIERIEMYGRAPAMDALDALRNLIEWHRSALVEHIMVPAELLTPEEKCELATTMHRPPIEVSRLAGSNGPFTACLDEPELDDDDEERRE